MNGGIMQIEFLCIATIPDGDTENSLDSLSRARMAQLALPIDSAALCSRDEEISFLLTREFCAPAR